MDISLREYSKLNNTSYTSAWRLAKSGKIPGTRFENGEYSISIPDKTEVVTQNNDLTREIRNQNFAAIKNTEEFYQKQSFAVDVGVRGGNKSANNQEDGKFSLFRNLYNPVRKSYTSNGLGSSCFTIKDVIDLTRIAYFNFSDVRNAVNISAEFCSSNIFLTGGNKKSREFYQAWFETINIQKFTNSFFIEFFRSANCFIYPLRGKVSKDYLVRIKEVVGSESVAAKLDLPLKYIMLNPSSIIYSDSAFVSSGKYYQELAADEVKKLQNPQTEQEKQIVDSLPKETKEQLKALKTTAMITIPLNSDNVIMVFNSKQDYEPFGVSMIWPVLNDIEHKEQLKKMDMAIATVCQSIICHINLGFLGPNGEYTFSAPAAQAVQEIMQNPSVFKCIITDFSGKIDYKVPQIGDLLDPRKYEIINQDIRSGLMNIFGGGGEKFANMAIQVKVFIERLCQAREVFLREFLIPEMNRIGRQIGFKNIPIPQFEDIDLEDPINFQRTVLRLGELGMLTADEVVEAIQSKRLPTPEESLESQKSYKEARDNQYYVPLIGGATQKEETADGSGSTNPKNGRPIGTTGIPKSTNKISPIGTKKASFDTENYELSKILEISKAEFDLKVSLADECKKVYKLDKLSTEQQNLVSDLSEQIMASSDIKEWKNDLTKYIKGNYKEDKEIKENINKLARDKNTTYDAAKLLYFSQKI